jgi:hypothetical protein
MLARATDGRSHFGVKRTAVVTAPCVCTELQIEDARTEFIATGRWQTHGAGVGMHSWFAAGTLFTSSYDGVARSC